MSNIDQSKSASRHGDLTTGNLTSHLIRLSGPMTWGILMVVGFQLVDTYFVSLLGGEKLAAFTFTQKTCTIVGGNFEMRLDHPPIRIIYLMYIWTVVKEPYKPCDGSCRR